MSGKGPAYVSELVTPSGPALGNLTQSYYLSSQLATGKQPFVVLRLFKRLFSSKKYKHEKHEIESNNGGVSERCRFCRFMTMLENSKTCGSLHVSLLGASCKKMVSFAQRHPSLDSARVALTVARNGERTK